MSNSKNDKLIYELSKRYGGVSRYEESRDGMEEIYNGDWVKYSDYVARVDELRAQIDKLAKEASSQYNKGYSSGQYAGPDYNMRND